MAETVPSKSASAGLNRVGAKRRGWLLAAIAVIVRLAVMAIWPSRAFSCDMKDWRIIAGAMLVGLNPYNQHYGPLLNWPPMWLELLCVLGKVSDRFDWSFFASIRVFLIAGDAILVLSTWRLLRFVGNERRAFMAMLFGLCLNPLLILLTIQQGNFDVIPTIGVVWVVYFLIQFGRSGDVVDWLCSAACLGMAAFAKTFPLVLLPLLVGPSRRVSWKARLLGVGLCAGPALFSLAPLYVLYPREITENVILYRGTPGAMGVSGILQLAGGLAAVSRYATFFTIALPMGMGVVTVILWRRPFRRESDLVLMAAILLMSVFEFGSGYCPQYWLWVAPLLAISYVNQPRTFRRVLIVSGVSIVLTTVLTFAYDSDLGSFMTWWSTARQNERLRDIFSDRMHGLILISLPMSAMTLLLWVHCCRAVLLSRRVSPDER